jgi:hypothetical protein
MVARRDLLANSKVARSAGAPVSHHAIGGGEGVSAILLGSKISWLRLGHAGVA